MFNEAGAAKLGKVGRGQAEGRRVSYGHELLSPLDLAQADQSHFRRRERHLPHVRAPFLASLPAPPSARSPAPAPPRPPRRSGVEAVAPRIPSVTPLTSPVCCPSRDCPVARLSHPL